MATTVLLFLNQACEYEPRPVGHPDSETAANSGGGEAIETPKASQPEFVDPSFRLSTHEILSRYASAGCDSLDGGLGEYLDGTGATDYFRGLSARIRVPPENFRQHLSEWERLDRYTRDDARLLETTLFFQSLNVPTRRFTEGFPKFSGAHVQGPDHTDLVEYFRLDFEGGLKLTADFPEGDYEFAVLSDDGARLELDGQAYLDSPGTQQTKLLCGGSGTGGTARSVNLSRTVELPFKLGYFQGPRYHIALMLLWRPASPTAEPLCGQSGNNLWFDSTKTPSQPTAKFNSLATRGWSVVPPELFRIPQSEFMNPCLSDHVKDVIREGCATAADCEGLGI